MHRFNNYNHVCCAYHITSGINIRADFEVSLKQTQCSVIDCSASLVKESIDSGHPQCSGSPDVHESSLQMTSERTLDLTWPELTPSQPLT